jgi:hypothetical protein
MFKTVVVHNDPAPNEWSNEWSTSAKCGTSMISSDYVHQTNKQKLKKMDCSCRQKLKKIGPEHPEMGGIQKG